MASLTLIFIKYLFIRIYFCGLNKRTNHECLFLCGFLLLSSFGSTASHFLTEREAFVTLEPEDIGGSLKRKANKISVIGTYAKIGSTGEAHGTLLQIPEDECGCDDSLSRQKKPRNWVALLHYPSEKSGQTTVINDTQCAGVIDRMRNVMMFGASAILILVMNPKIVKELDVPLMISQPIVLIQTATNVSAILEALINHVSVKVKIVAKQVESPQSDPGNFWNYFFSLLATFILLMILKNKSQGDDDWYPMDQGQVLQHMAKQALAVMTIRRFKVPEKPHQHSSNNRDICAICLENFFPRQRLRVLPCFHEFHTKCVDPWLLIHPTCPLCKLNILDLQLK